MKSNISEEGGLMPVTEKRVCAALSLVAMSGLCIACSTVQPARAYSQKATKPVSETIPLGVPEQERSVASSQEQEEGLRLQLQVDLVREALTAWHWQTGEAPDSIDDVLAANLLFFVPAAEDGTPLPVVDFQPGEGLDEPGLGVHFENGKVYFARYITPELLEDGPAAAPALDEEAGEYVDVSNEPPVETGEVDAEVFATYEYDEWIAALVEDHLVRPEWEREADSEIRATLDAYHTNNPGYSQSSLTLSYIMITDAWEARRAFAMRQQLQHLLLHYGNREENLPHSAEDLFGELGIAPAVWSAIEPPEQPAVEDVVVKLSTLPGESLALIELTPAWGLTYEGKYKLDITVDMNGVPITDLRDPVPVEWADWASPTVLFTAVIPDP